MLQVRRLGWSALDAEFPIGRGLSARIVERPGAWMDAPALADLTTELREVAAAAVPAGALPYGALTGERAALERAVLTIVHEGPARRPVAFSAMSLLPVTLDGHQRTVLHLGLALVHPAVRGRNLSRSVYGVTMFLMCLQHGFRPLWVSNVSQVPSAIGSFATYFDAAYPALTPSNRTPRHVAIAEQLVAHHRAAFGVGVDATLDVARFVILNAYTGGSDNLKKSFGEAARHRRSSYGALCLAQLDYERGDDFLQVGRYSVLVALRCFGRRLRHAAQRRSRVPRPEPGRLGYPA